MCFRDHLQLEPTLNHCKRRGRTGCMCSRSRRRGLSVLKVLGLRGWAVFPPRQKRSPARFYFLPTAPEATPHANPCWGVEEGIRSKQ